MFEHILDCPQCGHRFHFEHEGRRFPEEIGCPGCGRRSPKGDFEVLLLCHECHVKIKVPLPMLNEAGNCCPKCGAVIPCEPLTVSLDLADGSGNSSDAAQNMFNEGDFFDKYRIIRLLGKGGMAEVYLAEHMLLKQKCALKVMRRTLEQEDKAVYLKRFLREAKLTHSLSHPHIVKVFDAGSDFKTGVLFIAMEYIEGRTLRSMIVENLLSEDELLKLLNDIADALKVLDEAKVVHRDIKPSNIMYTREGVYKLMDLGIAKMENHQEGDETLTMAHTAIGTPGYASPEQCGSAHSVDGRSDIFSLGATIYHAASGIIPFEGETPVAAIIKTIQKEPEPLRRSRPDLSAAFLELVEKMMTKEPAGRFQSVDELKSAIAKAEKGRTFADFLVKVKKNTAATFAFLRQTAQKSGRILFPAGWSKAVFTGMLRFICGVKYLFSRDLSGNNEQERPGWFRRLLKLFLLLVIAGFAALHIYYGYNCLKGRTGKTGYGEFMKKFAHNLLFRNDLPLMERVALSTLFVQEGKKIVDRGAVIEKTLREAHPLLLDPDKTLLPAESANSVKYVMVGLEEPLKKKFFRQYDFNTVDRAVKGASPLMFRGGFLECGTRKEILSIPKKYKSSRHWSIFMNFLIREKNTAALISVNKLELFILDGTLRILYAGYHADTRIKIKPDEWVNLGLYMNHDEGRIDLISGNLLLGSYLFPKEKAPEFSALRFHSALLGKNMQGRVDYLGIYNKSLRLAPLPGNKRASFCTYPRRLGDRFFLPLIEKESPPETVAPIPEKEEKISEKNIAGKPAKVKMAPASFMRIWKERDIITLTKALSSGGISPNLQLRDGRTLLTSACAAEDPELVKLLLDNGADPNLRDGKKEIPLGGGRELFTLPKNMKNSIKILFMLLEKGAELGKPLLPGKPQYGLLQVIIAKYPEKNELLPRLAAYMKQIPDVQWEELLYTYNMTRSESQGGLSESNKRLLLEKCPVSVLKQHFGFVILRVRLTPETLRKMFDNGLKPDEAMNHNAYIKGRRQQVDRPLLYLLVIDRQPADVVETALKAGAFDKFLTWKDENGRTLVQLARDPVVRTLLERYRNDSLQHIKTGK